MFQIVQGFCFGRPRIWVGVFYLQAGSFGSSGQGACEHNKCRNDRGGNIVLGAEKVNNTEVVEG